MQLSELSRRWMNNGFPPHQLSHAAIQKLTLHCAESQQQDFHFPLSIGNSWRIKTEQKTRNCLPIKLSLGTCPTTNLGKIESIWLIQVWEMTHPPLATSVREFGAGQGLLHVFWSSTTEITQRQVVCLTTIQCKTTVHIYMCVFVH